MATRSHYGEIPAGEDNGWGYSHLDYQSSERQVKSIGPLIGPKQGGIFQLHSATTSGWQQSAGGKGSEVKGFEMERSVVKFHGKGWCYKPADNHCCLQVSESA